MLLLIAPSHCNGSYAHALRRTHVSLESATFLGYRDDHEVKLENIPSFRIHLRIRMWLGWV
jgi:hypothetical protein